MSTDRRIRASRTNGALARRPKLCLNPVKTGAFAKSIVLKNEFPVMLAELCDEYYQYIQPTNPIERNIAAQLVVSKSPLTSAALPHNQRSQVRNSRAFHRSLKQVHDLCRNTKSKNDQTDLVPYTDTGTRKIASPPRLSKFCGTLKVCIR